jgi:glycosyltransferase involved in cell wall biosynthesis
VATNRAIFIVWKVYQRRVEGLQNRFGASPVYLHFRWEERSQIHKAVSYLFKFCQTLWVLYTRTPELVYVQAPPVFAVFATWIYCRLWRVPYVVDAHNPMIYDTFWPRVPLAQVALRGATSVLVHNPYVADVARQMQLRSLVLIDRPVEVTPVADASIPAIVRGRTAPRVVVPCSFDLDEPLDELQKATRALPDVDFFITWYREKLPPEVAAGFGPNVILTGFLPLDEFNALLACADVILVLTTRDGTQPSGATEALSFERPLVVSDSDTIRTLFPKGAVYVENEGEAIARGLHAGLMNKARLSAEMGYFKAEKCSMWEQQFQTLQLLLATQTRAH